MSSLSESETEDITTTAEVNSKQWLVWKLVLEHLPFCDRFRYQIVCKLFANLLQNNPPKQLFAVVNTSLENVLHRYTIYPYHQLTYASLPKDEDKSNEKEKENYPDYPDSNDQTLWKYSHRYPASKDCWSVKSINQTFTVPLVFSPFRHLKKLVLHFYEHYVVDEPFPPAHMNVTYFRSLEELELHTDQPNFGNVIESWYGQEPLYNLRRLVLFSFYIPYVFTTCPNLEVLKMDSFTFVRMEGELVQFRKEGKKHPLKKLHILFREFYSLESLSEQDLLSPLSLEKLTLVAYQDSVSRLHSCRLFVGIPHVSFKFCCMQEAWDVDMLEQSLEGYIERIQKMIDLQQNKVTFNGFRLQKHHAPNDVFTFILSFNDRQFKFDGIDYDPLRADRFRSKTFKRYVLDPTINFGFDVLYEMEPLEFLEIQEPIPNDTLAEILQRLPLLRSFSLNYRQESYGEEREKFDLSLLLLCNRLEKLTLGQFSVINDQCILEAIQKIAFLTHVVLAVPFEVEFLNEISNVMYAKAKNDTHNRYKLSIETSERLSMSPDIKNFVFNQSAHLDEIVTIAEN